MAEVVSSSSDEAWGQIRLAWWREALERLDQMPPPGEWRLQSIYEQLLPRGISGATVAELEDCWVNLLKLFPWDEAVVAAIRRRGEILFGVGARLLGWPDSDGAPAGALWSLVDVAKHLSKENFAARRQLVVAAKAAIERLGPYKPPRSLRPLTVLAALAGHDVLRNLQTELEGPLERGNVAVFHMLRGNFPRG